MLTVTVLVVFGALGALGGVFDGEEKLLTTANEQLVKINDSIFTLQMQVATLEVLICVVWVVNTIVTACKK